MRLPNAIDAAFYAGVLLLKMVLSITAPAPRRLRVVSYVLAALAGGIVVGAFGESEGRPAGGVVFSPVQGPKV